MKTPKLKNTIVLGIIFQFLYEIPLLTASPLYSEIEDELPSPVDPSFSVDPQNLDLSEMVKNIQTISGAVMGTAELVLGIKSDLKLLRNELMLGKINMRFEGRQQNPLESQFQTKEEQVIYNQQLAEKIEKAFENGSTIAVDLMKEEIRKTIEINFIRVLAAILLHGPPSSQKRRGDILRLMKSALNDELDFKPVVEKLPFILRDFETNQFITLLQTIKEDEIPPLKKERQDDEDEDDDETTTASQPQIQYVIIPGKEDITTKKPTQAQVPSGPTVVNGKPDNQEVASIPATTAPTPPPTAAPIHIYIQQPPAPPPPPTTKKPNRFNQVLSGIGQIDVNAVSQILQNIPITSLIGGIENLVTNVEGLIP